MATQNDIDSVNWILNQPKESQTGLQDWGYQSGNPWIGNIVSSYKQIFGRPPTLNELEQATPAFQVPGGHGESYIAQLKQAEDNSPEKLAARADEKLKGKIPEQYDSVKSVFKETLGRDPNQQELDHFSKMIATGDADAYSISQGLQTLPEYQEPKDKAARESLRGELSTADTRFLSDEAFPTIQAQFAKQGRDVSAGNSTLQTALANAAGRLNKDRETYLATLGREDYTNRRQDSINNYLQGLQRQYQMNDTGMARNYQMQDQATARSQELENYYMQQSAYSNYLQNYGRRQSGGSGGIIGGALQGGVSGAGTGFTMGGPWGALIGGVAGAGLGAYGGSRQNGSIY